MKSSTQIQKTPKNIASAEVDSARMNEVFRWIIAGRSREDIELSIGEHWPDEASAPLIVTAMNQVVDAAAVDEDTIRGWCYEATRELYRLLLESGDLKGALVAVKQLRDLSRA